MIWTTCAAHECLYLNGGSFYAADAVFWHSTCVKGDRMTDTDTRINALLNAIGGLHSEFQVIPYGSPKRLIIYHDLLCCYREIFRLLRERRDLPYGAEHIRSVVSPKHAHLN